MKTNITPKIRFLQTAVTLLFLVVGFLGHSQQITTNFTEYKGEVINQSKDGLAFVNLTLESSNISTVTNSDGQFVLKVPSTQTQGRIIVSLLGYNTAYANLSEFNNKRLTIILSETTTELSQIDLGSTMTAAAVVKKALSLKDENYEDDRALMTAFYRETIKKRRRNVSLAEAVVTINKEPYDSFKTDKVALYKARKSTDYTQLDTVALKLQGGPLNALYADLMKYPEYFLAEGEFANYNFNFDSPTEVQGKKVYVVNFKQLPNIKGPFFYGKLYIDYETLALTDAIYSLNVEDREASSDLFVRKKPADATVYPTEADYRVNYRQNNGKWSYGYSNIYLEFVIDWNGRLFNSKYSLNSEMAITDVEIYDPQMPIRGKDRYRSSTILVDEASGFNDPEFWGEFNVIEPDKTIESAIEKIQRQLKRS